MHFLYVLKLTGTFTRCVSLCVFLNVCGHSSDLVKPEKPQYFWQTVMNEVLFPVLRNRSQLM